MKKTRDDNGTSTEGSYTGQVSRRALLRASLLGGAAAIGLGACGSGGSGSGSSASSTGSGAATSYSGEVFDAKGATLNMACWANPYQSLLDKYVLNKFKSDFNCKINYYSTFPWTPKFVANGPKNPPFDVANWNLPDLVQAAQAADFFVPVHELVQNVPNASQTWPFASANGHGLTYLYSQYGYAYRTDLVKPAPTSFKDFWDSRFANKRGTYSTDNTLQMVFFMMSALAYGGSAKDVQAGYKAMKAAKPVLVSNFTGNMQSQLTRGEVEIAVMDDGDTYYLVQHGAPVAQYYWTEKKPILTQTLTVSKHSKPTQQRLAYALVNRMMEKGFQENMGQALSYRPTNQQAAIPGRLVKLGVKNTADATKNLWVPPWDWFVKQEQQINTEVNTIFG